ncbi:uncharacterized protein LOC113324106 [Papaver somniferum]|uniref:uncharacterized protein LOC113324106 n=1 Tax=Papaver somniferum TaxID=3469 RepID=UPI000E6FA4E7|nr:uncharacterized protein LOC113324106 [Papaver somniferum]
MGDDIARTIWTPSMTRYFIELLKEQVLRGPRGKKKMSDSALRKQVWAHITSKIWGSVFFSTMDFYGTEPDIWWLLLMIICGIHTLRIVKSRAQYDKDAFYNRFKTLSKQYLCLRGLLGHGGLDWDKTLHMVKADAHVWDDYVKAHPDARQYRVRPVPHYEDLCIIYDISERNNNLGLDPVDNVQEDSSYLNSDILNQHNKRLLKSPIGSGYSNKLKNKDQSMIDAIQEMRSAVTLLAEKTGEMSDYVSTETWMAALGALPDTDEELFFDACDFLEVDAKRAKTFVLLDGSLQKKWLLRKLGSS